MASREDVVQALVDAAKVCADEVAQVASSGIGSNTAAYAAAARDFAEAAARVHEMKGRTSG